MLLRLLRNLLIRALLGADSVSDYGCGSSVGLPGNNMELYRLRTPSLMLMWSDSTSSRDVMGTHQHQQACLHRHLGRFLCDEGEG